MSTIGELQERVRSAASAGTPLRLRGGGTKDFYGCAPEGELLELGGYAGIVDGTDPTKFFLTPEESDGDKLWNFASFSPDGSKLITVWDGVMSLRDGSKKMSKSEMTSDAALIYLELGRPADALRRYAQGDFFIIFPTIRTLERLQHHAGVDAVMAACASERPS